MYEGGGLELYQQFYKDVLKLNVIPLPAFPSGPQAFGWFKRPIKNLADFKGMKCRQTGINAEVFTEMGMRTVNLPGGEILPAAERASSTARSGSAASRTSSSGSTTCGSTTTPRACTSR